MKRADPAEMRKIMKVVESMKRSGILFVPIPVMNETDHITLLDTLKGRMDHLVKKAEKTAKAEEEEKNGKEEREEVGAQVPESIEEKGQS